ncbi:ABC transporter permease [Eisenbergiella tayi]|uniref:ABC transporter permease n=1 Tax=Eisenbergiella porci TaxID=2652274 RepID=A0A6N7WRF3_9FIRM|nr:ABC transporter permease [Eisenbergiella porci]MSS91990.1 ABC transporter permease [Eisenbergiella porci]
MWRGFSYLLKKDFKMMLSSKFFLLALCSVVLYSCYINYVYVNLDQDIYPVYLYDPNNTQHIVSEYVTKVDTRAALEEACADEYSVGVDFSTVTPEVYMLSSGTETTDYLRGIYAEKIVSSGVEDQAEIIGTNDKELKNRREITAEFLFFELSAVGFLGLAAMLFKEKQMGVIRVHGVLPVCKSAFILSKLCWILLSDVLFTILLTLINIGVENGISILPAVLIQAGILSLIMALAGFLCAVCLPDFKQFSLFYLIIAIFITTPVFLAGQTGIEWEWIVYHPMYHLFVGMKSAYFAAPAPAYPYYLICTGVIVLLFLFAHRTLTNEMAKEG